MVNIQSASLLDLLPYNLRADPTVAAAALAIDGELQAVSGLIDPLVYFARLDNLTEEETDELAWQFHVDFYDPTLPLPQRRELVKNSYRWHRIKGTPSAVEELMTAIFGDGIVEEWYEYGGQPYYFRVITSNFSATTEHAQRFLSLVQSVKNARSWLDGVIIRLVEITPVYWGTAIYVTEKLQVTQEGLP